MNTQLKSKPNQPSFQILICLIKIWTPENKNDVMTVPNDAMLISEVETIEIEESYRKLIGTASVKLPRGTVIRQTVACHNEWAVAGQITASITDNGVVEEVRHGTTKVASTNHFTVGQRIRIYLGYTEDPAIADLAKTNRPKSIFNNMDLLNKYQDATYQAEKAMNIMFDGYITKVSVDTPIELHCETLASALKNITCPDYTFTSNCTINDFLADDGKLQLLKGTGIILHPETKANVYDLGNVEINSDWTVADVLMHWAKYGIHSFVTEYNGQPAIAVGRSYFSNAGNDSIINANTQPAKPVEILFDYHVAQNGLSLTSTDKKFLAVEAEGLVIEDDKDKFIHVTILRNPNYDSSDSGSDKYRVVNESKLSKKAMKLGATPLSKSADKMDMSLYTVVPYHSRKIPVTKDELVEEAIKYMESYNMNGIEGNLTLFGDLHLHTATKVQLTDKRYPGKNGVYLVDEVFTTFGVGGYRQRITLPYCIKRDKQENNEQK